jgi:peptidyl-prolyl cis-trans isomerase C
MRSRTSWLLVWTLTCACDKAPRETAQPATTAPAATHTATVLRIGQHEVTGEQFARLLGPPPMQRGRAPEAQRRREFLDKLARTELLAVEATRRGLFDRADIRGLARKRAVEAMTEEMIGEHGSAIAPVTDDDVRDYYDDNLAQFSASERVRARHILVKTEKAAQQLLARLRKDPVDLRAFAALATEHSLDAATRQKGGDLGAFTREPPSPMLMDAIASASLRPRHIPAAVRAAAFDLERAGDVSDPVKSEHGYHIVQLGGHLPATRYELEQVRQLIARTLREQRQQDALAAFTEHLLTEARVTVHKDKLSQVRP